MKKYIPILFGMLLTISSCVNDDSTTFNKIDDIVITPFNEDGYTAIAYSDENFELEAEVETNYPESDISYTWYIYNDYEDTQLSDYTREKVAEGKKLSYSFNVDPGNYTFIFEAKAKNGYAVTERAKVNVVTNFSDGFYVFKELPGEKCDVDIYKKDNNMLISNVISSVNGSSVVGKPEMMSMCFNHGYIDSKNNKQSTNLLTLTTTDGGFTSFSTNNLAPILDRSKLLYSGALPNDVKPYMIISGFYQNFLFSSDGLRCCSDAIYSPQTGMYGSISDNGSSHFAFYYAYSVYYWDEQTKSIHYADWNGASHSIEDVENPSNNLEDYKCIACGNNVFGNKGLFILENCNNQERKIYIIGDEGNEIKILNDDLHITKSDKITFSSTSSTFIYSLDNNKVYAYDYMNEQEVEIIADGLDTNEKITYISESNFDGENYFIIGTQQEDGYKLYFYDILGGKLKGTPLFTCHGAGILKSVRYTKSGYKTSESYSPKPFFPSYQD